MNQPDWRKSSRSNSESMCIELLVKRELTGIRDSKAPAAGQLTFGEASYRAFLAGVRGGSLGRQR